MSSANDIIVAPATLTGGAIAIVRLSGEGSIELCDSVFRGKGVALTDAKSHTLHYGDIVDAERVIDDVVVSVFRNPRSYTGEDSIEISCHGSHYITQEIIALLISKGARTADCGEFTIRAYLAGRMDLSQAEAVADIIAAGSRAQLTMASTQMRGGYSSRLSDMRGQLLQLVALLELELDFSEEEVEFADRERLSSLMSELSAEIGELTSSFAVGNAIKQGVPVAIIGEPNVGKSTLLNRLLNDERAMVSDIAGTTRDLIEEELTIDGVTFRFIDTAGIHSTDDRLEQMGIERTLSAIERAQIIIYMTDAESNGESKSKIDNITLRQDQRLIKVINKIDINPNDDNSLSSQGAIKISAKEGSGIKTLIEELGNQINTHQLFNGAPIVSNTRHYELLSRANQALTTAQQGLKDNLPTDLLCQDIRETLHHLGTITGEITTNDILTEIFSKFCIGK